MLLYQHASGHYLAVTPSMRFKPAAGFTLCFEGRNVPDLICRAYVAEHGGQLVHEADSIVLSNDPAPLTARTAPAC